MVTIRKGYDKDLRFMISIASDRIKKIRNYKKELQRRADTDHSIATIVQFCQSARDNRQETTTVINQVAKTDSRRKKTRESACMH